MIASRDRHHHAYGETAHVSPRCLNRVKGRQLSPRDRRVASYLETTFVMTCQLRLPEFSGRTLMPRILLGEYTLVTRLKLISESAEDAVFYAANLSSAPTSASGSYDVVHAHRRLCIAISWLCLFGTRQNRCSPHRYSVSNLSQPPRSWPRWLTGRVRSKPYALSLATRRHEFRL